MHRTRARVVRRATWPTQLMLALSTVLLVEALARLLLFAQPAVPPPRVRFTFPDVWAHARNPFHEADPERFWRLKPGYSEGLITINREGFRGPEVAPAKAPGTYRIVALGDSITFGYNVPESETYPRRLERAIAGRIGTGRRVEVVNAGVIGYTSWQGRLTYERVIHRLSPDLIIVMFGYNDHHSAAQSDIEKYRRRYFDSITNVLSYSGLFRLMARIRERVAGADLRQEPVPRVDLDQFQQSLLALHTSATRDGARCVFMTTAVREGVPLVENFRAVDFTEHDRGQRVWIRQIDFALRVLPPDRGRDVYRHFLDWDSSLEPFVTDDSACAQVHGLSSQFQSFPIFAYLDARCAAARGNDAGARRAFDRARANDTERQQLAAYNGAVRSIAERSRADLVDLDTVLTSHNGATVSLLSDSIHPTPAGDALIAETLANRLTPTVMSR
jgi:lysophospholipase L1-like esterase